MKNKLLKSVGAILIGFVVVVILSILTDTILEKTGLMKQPFDLNSTAFIAFVALYRSLFGVLGSYLTARFAPDKPMLHAMIGGFIGLVIATAGAIAMWHIPPHWYPIALIITVLPTAWLGGKLHLRNANVAHR